MSKRHVVRWTTGGNSYRAVLNELWTVERLFSDAMQNDSWRDIAVEPWVMLTLLDATVAGNTSLAEEEVSDGND